MWTILRLVLAIFIIASSCGGFPTSTLDGAADDLPKDEYSDVIRLLNSSAHADSAEQAKLDHAARVSPHGAQKYPLVSTDSVGAPKSAKKLSKTSPVKKHRSRKSKNKPKTTVKSETVHSQILNDSPASDRVREVLSRRRISSNPVTKVASQRQGAVAPEIMPQLLPYPQPAYNPYQFQPSYYNNPHQFSYPTFYDNHSYPPVNPFFTPQYPYSPDNNNWNNNIQNDPIPFNPIVKIPKVEPPEMSWEAVIEYPDKPPIVITSHNYSNNPHADVNILSEPEKPAATPAKHTWTPPPVISHQSGTVGAYSYRSPPSIIWSQGISYVPLSALFQSQYLDSPVPMATHYNSKAGPFNFLTPPVYYQPPSNLPYTQNTPVQTWLPSSKPFYPTWPVGPQQLFNGYQSHGKNHEVNVYPVTTSDQGRDTSVDEETLHVSVYEGSKEVSGDKLEVNVFQADKNAADMNDSDEIKLAPAPAYFKVDDDDSDD